MQYNNGVPPPRPPPPPPPPPHRPPPLFPRKSVKSTDYCTHCKNVGKPDYASHTNNECPVLLNLPPCQFCGATGALNHTEMYCPVKPDEHLEHDRQTMNRIGAMLERPAGQLMPITPPRASNSSENGFRRRSTISSNSTSSSSQEHYHHFGSFAQSPPTDHSIRINPQINNANRRRAESENWGGRQVQAVHAGGPNRRTMSAGSAASPSGAIRRLSFDNVGLPPQEQQIEEEDEMDEEEENAGPGPSCWR